MLKYLTLAGLACLTATAASAEDYAVKEIQYRNKGAYLAYVAIEYYDPTNRVTCMLYSKAGGKGTISNGSSQTFRLGNQNGYKLAETQPTGCSTNIPEGAQVWATVAISVPVVGLTLGLFDGGSCRKDGTRFFYYEKGGQVDYFSAGTAKNNNRCQIKRRGGVTVASLSQ